MHTLLVVRFGVLVAFGQDFLLYAAEKWKWFNTLGKRRQPTEEKN